MADSHQPDVLIAAVKRRHVQAVLSNLQVAAAVDHLGQADTAGNNISHTEGRDMFDELRPGPDVRF